MTFDGQMQEEKRIVNEKILKKRDRFRHKELERISYAQGLRFKLVIVILISIILLPFNYYYHY